MSFLSPAAPKLAPWKVLLVDDEPDIHDVTKLTLHRFRLDGRALSFVHAYSGAEAKEVLAREKDIALVFLDVVMEREDSGLEVARWMRQDLNNQFTRIVLRTGQPGQALEHSIILDYDINDFWCKTDLTTRKLFTTVISSLRAYNGLEVAHRRTTSLQAELDHAQRLLSAVDQHALIVTLDRTGKIASVNEKFCSVFQFSREELVGADLRQLHPAPYPPDQLADALHAVKEHESWTDVITAWRRDGQEIRLRITVSDLDEAPAPYIVVGSVLQPLKKTA